MSGSNALLDSLAHPAQVNLLADYQGAANTANSIWRNRLWQSQQAAGDAFRGSITNGMPNQTQLLTNLKGDPNTSLSALETSQQGQSLDNATFTTQQARLAALAQANMELYARFGGKPPLDVIKQNIENHAAQLGFTPEQKAQAEAQFGPDGAENGRVMLQNTSKGLSALEALHAGQPGTGTVTGPNGTLQGYQTPPLLSGGGGAVSSPPQTGAQQGPSPEWLSSVSTITNADGSTSTDSNAGHIRAGRISPMGAPMPGYSAATPQTTRPAAGLPGGAGPQGNPNAFDGLPPPQSAIPQSGNPLYGPLPDEPPAKAAPTPTGPRQGGTTIAPQLVAQQAEDVKAYKADQLALPSKRTSDENMSMAFKALKLTTTGAGADATHQLYSYLQTAGLLPAGATDELKNYQEFKKLTERRIAELGMAAGTDAGRALAGQSNPGASISTPANLDFIRNDVGKNRQQMAINLTAPEGGVGYGDHASTTAGKTDFRGFNWKWYSPDEQAKIMKSVGKQGSAAELALQRAKGMAHALNLDKSD